MSTNASVGRSLGRILVVGVAAVVGVSTFPPPTPRLLWNTTASAPIGLYRLHPDRRLAIGDLVAVRPPAPIARVFAEGGYLPPGVPLLKRVVALAGTTVCRIGDTVTIEGNPVGTAQPRDRRGRALPVWAGCRTLHAGEMFLLNPHPDSLDSRYFGSFPVASVLGRATPLWLVDVAPDRFSNP